MFLAADVFERPFLAHRCCNGGPWGAPQLWGWPIHASVRCSLAKIQIPSAPKKKQRVAEYSWVFFEALLEFRVGFCFFPFFSRSVCVTLSLSFLGVILGAHTGPNRQRVIELNRGFNRAARGVVARFPGGWHCHLEGSKILCIMIGSSGIDCGWKSSCSYRSLKLPTAEWKHVQYSTYLSSHIIRYLPRGIPFHARRLPKRLLTRVLQRLHPCAESSCAAHPARNGDG